MQSPNGDALDFATSDGPAGKPEAFGLRPLPALGWCPFRSSLLIHRLLAISVSHARGDTASVLWVLPGDRSAGAASNVIIIRLIETRPIARMIALLRFALPAFTATASPPAGSLNYLARFVSAPRPASVMRTRVVSMARPPAITRSACAFASPVQINSTIIPVEKPGASKIASVMPSGDAASSASARRRSELRLNADGGGERPAGLRGTRLNRSP
jgi:hypothetical protein